MLSDSERIQALEAATVVVCPSPYESLSLLALEALAAGTPILANARSAVLVEHCVKSNGGLYYADRDEFIECLKVLLGDARLRETLGRNGREYVRRNYRWEVVGSMSGFSQESGTLADLQSARSPQHVVRDQPNRRSGHRPQEKIQRGNGQTRLDCPKDPTVCRFL